MEESRSEFDDGGTGVRGRRGGKEWKGNKRRGGAYWEKRSNENQLIDEGERKRDED